MMRSHSSIVKSHVITVPPNVPSRTGTQLLIQMPRHAATGRDEAGSAPAQEPVGRTIATTSGASASSHAGRVEPTSRQPVRR